MKKFLILSLTLILILGVFVSCDKETDDSEETGCSVSEAEEHTFSASIIEINGVSVLVEPLEGEWERNSADRIWINAEGFDDIGAEVGDVVEITYDGYIMETYPAQIRASGWRKAE